MDKDKNEPKIIYLRGHHLRALKIFLLKGAEYMRNWVISDPQYGETETERINFTDNANAVLWSILNSEENALIKITDTIDDVCQHCRNKDALRCKNRGYHNDETIAREFGFEMNKIYTTKQIINRISIIILREESLHEQKDR